MASGAPRTALSGSEKPPTRPPLVFPLLYPSTRPLYPARRVSPITRKGLSLLPLVVRRNQHLSLGRQPRSPERSTHFSLGCLSKATPDSSGLRIPPSRTLLLYNGSLLQEPHSPDNLTTQRTCTEICTPQCVSFGQQTLYTQINLVIT